MKRRKGEGGGGGMRRVMVDVLWVGGDDTGRVLNGGGRGCFIPRKGRRGGV